MLHVCASAQEQIDRLCDAVCAALRTDLAADGRALLVVSGGRSPQALFDALATAPLDWSRVTVTLADERVVPADHPDSNAALVRGHLLRAAAAQARFIPLVDDAADPQSCAARATARWRTLAQPPSVVVLGMGEDGHTASLFPGAAELPAALDPACPSAYVHITPPAAPHRRISLSLAAILQARRLLLSIAGQTKRAVFEQASVPPPRAQWPISFLIQQTRVPLDAFWTA
ncbi:MAG: 6-phosphogluconolactonase [Thiomonas sp.]